MYVHLLQTVTGDTIVASKASAEAALRRAQNQTVNGEEHVNVILSGVEVPDPVFFCTIELPSMAKQAGELY